MLSETSHSSNRLAANPNDDPYTGCPSEGRNQWQHHQRPPLIYAGNKSSYGAVLRAFGPKDWRRFTLVDPFVGSGGLLLAAPDCAGYEASDINSDVVKVLEDARDRPLELISELGELFVPENNTDARYRLLKSEFNSHESSFSRSALFVFLNRHGFNGLVRYNRRGEFNVAFGKRRRPHLPNAEILALSAFLQQRRVSLSTCDFKTKLSAIRTRSVIVIDCPYLGEDGAAAAGIYRVGDFGEEEQKRLAALAHELARDGHYVIAFNYASSRTRELHHQATELHELNARTRIAPTAAGRGAVRELVAVYRP